MLCPACKTENLDAALRCTKCGTPLSSSDLTSDAGISEGWSVRGSNAGEVSTESATLLPGAVLAKRYELVQLLGEGGMGAVYKARDKELDRLVAVKIIRPDLAKNPEVLKRFKQELILARKVTHTNVIRIFDLGESDGTKFITMEFIEGRDLKSLIHEKGKLSTDETIAIFKQVCRALQAAHAQGVIHRDLKPQNIMLDTSGRAAVMDFGIARSAEHSGMTQTGALVGTPDYMSPEQAKGQPVDARSDLFSLGIILYEMLTGELPYKADTALGALMKRTLERPLAPSKLDASVPRGLNSVVLQCLEIEPKRRFQSAQEILIALDTAGARRSTGAGTSLSINLPLARSLLSWRGAVALVVVVGLAASLYVFRGRIFPPKPSAAREPVTVLLADFDNQTHEAVFDGTLEPMLSIALEGAPFISSFDRGAARRAAVKLQPGATRLDESLARLVAVREGVSMVVSGSLALRDGKYALSLRAVDAASGKTVTTQKTESSKKDEILAALGKSAAKIRSDLGDTTPESAQLSSAETFSAASLGAAHAYAQAQQMQWAGKWEDAARSYSHAIQLDPNFGRAYAGLATIQFNMGRRAEAEKTYQQALAQIDRMTPREKFRTRGAYFLAVRNQDKAIEEYTQLIQQFPADSAGLSNLALSYFFKRDMPRAMEYGRKSVELRPKNVLQRNNLALYAMYAGDFATAEREVRAVLELNPAFEKAQGALALIQFAQGKPAEAKSTYEQLQGVSTWGASTASIGLADIALYEGRAAEAQGLLEKGIAGDVANKDTDAAANKNVALAEVLLRGGKKPAALTAAEKAVSLSKLEDVLYRAALVNLQAGQEAKAKSIAAELHTRLEPEPQIFAKLIEGEIALHRGDKPEFAREAVSLFQDAQKIADTWLGRFALGRAYLAAGAFAEADTEFETCLKRRGEATAVFLDDVPTYRVFPLVHYYLGRAQEGLKSPAAMESYKTFLSIKEKDEGDPLVLDARRRIAVN